MTPKTSKDLKITLQEIAELLKIPKVEKYLINAVEEAKKKFADEITRFRTISRPRIINEKTKDKSYFFELNRLDDPKGAVGFKWELGRFKLRENESQDVMEILTQFIQKVEYYDIIPQQMQTKEMASPTSQKSFKITFMKSDQARVVGFLEESDEEHKEPEANKKQFNLKNEEEYIVKDEGEMVKVSVKHPALEKDDMFNKIYQLMEEDEDARNDIFFYYLMVQKSKG